MIDRNQWVLTTEIGPQPYIITIEHRLDNLGDIVQVVDLCVARAQLRVQVTRFGRWIVDCVTGRVVQWRPWFTTMLQLTALGHRLVLRHGHDRFRSETVQRRFGLLSFRWLFLLVGMKTLGMGQFTPDNVMVRLMVQIKIIGNGTELWWRYGRSIHYDGIIRWWRNKMRNHGLMLGWSTTAVPRLIWRCTVKWNTGFILEQLSTNYPPNQCLPCWMVSKDQEQANGNAVRPLEVPRTTSLHFRIHF